MARILFVIELPEDDNRPRSAVDLATRLRAQIGSAARAAMTVGVTRQAFHDWLAGHPVAMKHIIAMKALLAVGNHAPLDISIDVEDEIQ
jgi:hypothetical protein